MEDRDRDEVINISNQIKILDVLPTDHSGSDNSLSRRIIVASRVVVANSRTHRRRRHHLLKSESLSSFLLSLLPILILFSFDKPVRICSILS